ncbi:hypothetical protein D3C72_1525340 [compost metagenome]
MPVAGRFRQNRRELGSQRTSAHQGGGVKPGDLCEVMREKPLEFAGKGRLDDRNPGSTEGRGANQCASAGYHAAQRRPEAQNQQGAEHCPAGAEPLA